MLDAIATPFGWLMMRLYELTNNFGWAIIPVSYTHLDVYKRQVMGRPITGADDPVAAWKRARAEFCGGEM